MKPDLRAMLRPSLATLFFRYYLSALIALVLIVSVVGVIVDHTYNGVDEENGRNFMRGTVILVEQELQRHPETEWNDVLAKMAQTFSYKVALTDLSNLSNIPTLDDTERQDITRGINRFDEDSLTVYSRVGESTRVLMLGPLNFTPSDSDSLLEDGTHAKALWWMLTGLGFGLLVFLAIRPLWNDLVAIRDTAGQLASGDLTARAPKAKSWLLLPLSQGLNGMADRLQIQMTAHQALSHAVAHELRMPIARLRFGLTMMAEAENEEDRQKFRNSMERDMHELDGLVNASMSYAQLDQGDVVLQWETTELPEWFGELLELVRPLAGPDISLGLSCPRTDAEFDRKLMYVATRNLLVNAARFASTSIRLKVEKRDNGLDIIVDDDGPGVPLAERDRIFEPFHRLGHSRDLPDGSFGLGLSFVRLIAKLHGGSAHVTDSPEGGARFVIHIPAHEDEQEENE
jgi:signal transduction histidine kinase